MFTCISGIIFSGLAAALNVPPDAHSPSATDALHALIVTFLSHICTNTWFLPLWLFRNMFFLSVCPPSPPSASSVSLCPSFPLLTAGVVMWLSPSRALEVSLWSFQAFFVLPLRLFASFTETLTPLLFSPAFIHLYQWGSHVYFTTLTPKSWTQSVKLSFETFKLEIPSRHVYKIIYFK